MEIDTVLSDTEEREYTTSETDWETLYHFPITLAAFESFKVWIQAKAEGGGTAWVRIQITDGVDTFETSGISTPNSSYAIIGPDVCTYPDNLSETQLWTVNIQGKIADGGTAMWATGGTHQRYAST